MNMIEQKDLPKVCEEEVNEKINFYTKLYPEQKDFIKKVRPQTMVLREVSRIYGGEDCSTYNCISVFSYIRSAKEHRLYREGDEYWGSFVEYLIKNDYDLLKASNDLLRWIGFSKAIEDEIKSTIF